jgi:hypothetical protein
VDIRAPQGGTVFQLGLHTIGGIQASEAVMLIGSRWGQSVEAKANEQVQLD